MAVSAKELQRRIEGFTALCRAEGLKVTHQRTEIYRELARTDEHPDALAIYRRVRRRIPSISFDTVYRALRLLENKGVIRRVGTPADSAQFDANRETHHHFVCSACGAVRDFRCTAFDALEAPAAARQIGTPDSLRVEVRGVCAACARRRARAG